MFQHVATTKEACSFRNSDYDCDRKNRKHLRLRHHHFLFQEFPSCLVFDLFTLDMQKPINTYKIWHFYYPHDQMHGLYSPTFTPTNNPASKVVCIHIMCIYTILYTILYTTYYFLYVYYIYDIKLHYTKIHHAWSFLHGSQETLRASARRSKFCRSQSHSSEDPSSYDSFRTCLPSSKLT